MTRKIALMIVPLGGLLHGLQLVKGWDRVESVRHGRDFASYYYAVQVAGEGNNPYQKAFLGQRARSDGTRGSVHPFFIRRPFFCS